MRILIVTSRYLPHRGGLETVVRELSRQWQLAGHSVALVTNRYPRSLPKRETIDGIPVRRLQFLYPRLSYLKTGRVDLWLAGWCYFPLTLLQVSILMVRYQPDVVNLHYLGNPGLFLWALHYLLRFRLVVSMHGGDVDGEPFRNRFNLWLFRAVVNRAEQVTVCSQALLDQALTLAPEIDSKAHVIHNGVDIDIFANAQLYSNVAPYVLAVGQLERHKGFDVLLSAWAQIFPDSSETELLIAGEGHERTSLETQVQTAGLHGRVHLLGAVSREQVAALMRGSLMIVIPSLREPFGIVALEAMAAGRHIVASRVGGLKEALEGADIVWVQPGDIASLRDGLYASISKMGQFDAVGKNNQRLAAKFDWRVIANRYIAVLSREMEQ